MIFACRKPKTTVFTMFFAFGSKNHGIYSVFCSRPSKNTGIYAVFTLLQDIVSIYKNKKTLYFTMFLLPVSSQKSSKNSSKTVKNRLPDTSDNFSLVFPGPDPQKRENTSRIKDFGGSCKLCSHTASIAGFKGLRPTAGQGPT